MGMFKALIEWLGSVNAKLSEPGIITITLIVAVAFVLHRRLPDITTAYVKLVETKEKYRTQRARVEADLQKRLQQSPPPVVNTTKGQRPRNGQPSREKGAGTK